MVVPGLSAVSRASTASLSIVASRSKMTGAACMHATRIVVSMRLSLRGCLVHARAELGNERGECGGALLCGLDGA